MIAAFVSAYAFSSASAAYCTLMGVIIAAASFFSLWTLYSTRYQIGETQLLIFSGPFRWRIPLAAISEVKPSRNPLSGPACSLDRLQLKYNTAKFGSSKTILISPREKSAFLAELKLKATNLTN